MFFALCKILLVLAYLNSAPKFPVVPLFCISGSVWLIERCHPRGCRLSTLVTPDRPVVAVKEAGAGWRTGERGAACVRRSHTIVSVCVGGGLRDHRGRQPYKVNG